MASFSEPLTVEKIRKIWKTEFLPNIKKEIRNELKTEIEKINCLITNLLKHLDSIELSQQLISDKYDSLLKSMLSIKKQINDLNNWCEAQDNKINHLNGLVYDAEAAIDSIQQYSRRDCLEILGIPILPLDSQANLAQEIGQLIGVTIDKQDISIAHQLPILRVRRTNLLSTSSVEKSKTNSTSHASTSVGKRQACFHPWLVRWGKASTKTYINELIMYINESLTQYRNELFGRVDKFKKENKYEFLWMNNGKIYLRKLETSQTFTFTTFEEFEDFIAPSQ